MGGQDNSEDHTRNVFISLRQILLSSSTKCAIVLCSPTCFFFVPTQPEVVLNWRIYTLHKASPRVPLYLKEAFHYVVHLAQLPCHDVRHTADYHNVVSCSAFVLSDTLPIQQDECVTFFFMCII